MIDVTLAGEIARGKELLRSGARPGDRIFVSGSLGQSARGLEILESRASARRGVQAARQESSEAEAAVKAHLYPEPRCELGRWLQRSGIPSAQMDISDGLSTDLRRLCEASEVGAKIEAGSVPCPADVTPEYSLGLALNGGEDYELLFTVPRRRVAKVPRSHRGIPLRCIGQISRPKEVLLIGKDGSQSPLAPAGYDHFSK